MATTPQFDRARLLVESQLSKLKTALNRERLPDGREFTEISRSLEKLPSLCPEGQEGVLSRLRNEFEAVLREARTHYLGTIENALHNSTKLLGSGLQAEVTRLIDVLAQFDSGLADEKRRQLHVTVQTERTRQLVKETERKVQELWDQGGRLGTSDGILKAFEDARDVARRAVQQARELQASSEEITKLRILERQSSDRYDEKRKQLLVPVTLDQAGKFKDLIEDFQALQERDPNALVEYYTAGRDITETLPVSEALPVARRRWGAFVEDKAEQYRKNAEQKLKNNDPEGAREALNEMIKIGIPDPKILLRVDESPVEISGDLRIDLADIFKALEAAEENLREFRSFLQSTHSASAAEEAWHLLIQAREKFPRFVGKASWDEVYATSLARYRQLLQDRLEQARNALVRSEYADANSLAQKVTEAASSAEELRDIAREGERIRDFCLDVRQTLNTVNDQLGSRKLDQAEEALTRIIALERSLHAAGCDNVMGVVVARARAEAAVRSNQLLERLKAEAESNDVETLERALAQAQSAEETLPAEWMKGLTAIRTLLDAKLALALGEHAYEQGDLEKAEEHFRQAQQHPRLQTEARKNLQKVRETVQADDAVRAALARVPGLSVFQAVEELRHLGQSPTHLRQELDSALKVAEDRCRAALEKELSALCEAPDFDVAEAREKLRQLDIVDLQRAGELKARLTVPLANREAQIAWDEKRWVQARAKWEVAAQVNPTFELQFRAASKQETLAFADALMQGVPEQVVNDLEQKLQERFPGDPHLLLELAQALLALTDNKPWATAEGIFARAAQAASLGLRSASRWMHSLPDYEQERQDLLERVAHPVEGPTDLADFARELETQIANKKTIARRQARIRSHLIGDNGRKPSFVNVLSALKEKDRLLEEASRFAGGEDLEQWWRSLSNQTVFELESRLSENAKPLDGVSFAARSDGEAETEDTWAALEMRLCILVLDPDSPQGRGACSELPNQVTALKARFDSERQNLQGNGVIGAEKELLSLHFDRLRPVFARMRVMEEALLHLANHANGSALPPPPNATWTQLQERFHEGARPFGEFYDTLRRLCAVKDQVEQQIQAALGTGEWEQVEEALKQGQMNPLAERLLNSHRTFLWLKKELEEKKEWRRRLVRRRDEALWCLQWQEQVDVQPWAETEPALSTPHADADSLVDKAWALEMARNARRRAQTPVEVDSLLELALTHLSALQNEDKGDICSLQSAMEWTQPTTLQVCYGVKDIKEGIHTLLEEIDAHRIWIQPVTGGRLPARASHNPNEANTTSGNSFPTAGMVDWRRTLEQIDEKRRRGEFDDALARCRQAREGSAANGSEVWSLTQARDYLQKRNPWENRRLHTGLARMLAEYAKERRSGVEREIAEAERVEHRLEAWKPDYDIAWQNFTGQLKEYAQLSSRAQWLLVGRLWKQQAEDALWKARETYRKCHEICPTAPNLTPQRTMLVIEDRGLPEALPLLGGKAEAS